MSALTVLFLGRYFPRTGALAAAQKSPSKKPQKEAVLKVKSRVLEVSVVVHDKKGNPVTDLKQSDFELYDDGHRQPIQFFNPVGGTVTSKLPPKLAPGVFTNVVAQKGGVPANLVIVLVDALNTPFADQIYAKRQLLSYLKQLKPQDHVAIYVLTNKLSVLQDFTTDDALLIRAAREYMASHVAQQAASHPAGGFKPPGTRVTNKYMRLLIARMQTLDENIAQKYTSDRVGITMNAFRAIALHVRGIPGRKNLLWLSGSFPLAIGMDSLATALKDPHASMPTFTFGLLAETVRDLNDANVAVYPVDASALEAPTAAPPMFQNNGHFDERGWPVNGDRLMTMETVADRTGGRALYNRNDINHSLEVATEDAEFSYILGYAPHVRWDGKFHKLKVKVDRKGLRVRYRRGYFAVPPSEYKRAQLNFLLYQAVTCPVDATELPLVVHIDPVPGVHRIEGMAVREVSAKVFVYGHSVQFTPHGADEVANLNYVVAQRDAQGVVLGDTERTDHFTFGAKLYRETVKGGVRWESRIYLDVRASDLRIVVRDAADGALGSVTIPLDAIHFRSPATTSTSTPKSKSN